MTSDRMVDQPVMLLGDGGIFVALRLGGCGRKADETRRSIVTPCVQDRSAAHDDGRSIRSGAEKHGEKAEDHFVGDDEVGGECPQGLLQALVLTGDGVNQIPLHCDTHPLRPGRNVLQFRNGVQEAVEIHLRGKRVEGYPGPFDTFAVGPARQHRDLVTFVEHDTPNGKNRVDVARPQC